MVIRYFPVCNICGAGEFHPMAERSDGVAVVACSNCGHGVVESFRPDVLNIYSDNYYASEDEPWGYSDYEYTGEHGVAWARALAALLRPEGVVLDIGCADGRALKSLGSSYTKLGIEVNRSMAARAARNGVEIIAHDLLDPSLEARANSVDLVLAIAVFEHIPDIRGSVEAAFRLLKPGGLLVFEVPLIRSSSDVWFRSSLEHLHYPTEQSVEHLFRRVLGIPLWGVAVEARDFGWLYVGVTVKAPASAAALEERLNTLVLGSPSALSPEERRFRCLFDLVHLARAERETVPLLESLRQVDFTPPMVARLAAIWGADQIRRKASSDDWKALAEHWRKQAAETSEYLKCVENARDWHASESAKREKAIEEYRSQLSKLQAHVAELQKERGSKVGTGPAGDEFRLQISQLRARLAEVEKARDWNAAESVRREQALEGYRRQTAELQAHLAEVEKARDWSAGESARREEALEGYRRQTAELQAHLAEVEKARDWNAGESARREEALGEYRRKLAELQAHVAEVEKARDWNAAESARREQALEDYRREAAELRAYITDLEKARDWHAAESAKRDDAIHELHSRIEKLEQAP